MKPPTVAITFAVLAIAGVAGFFWNADAVRRSSGKPAIVFDNEQVCVARLGFHDRMQTHFFSQGIFYAVEDHHLYSSIDSGETFRRLGQFARGGSGMVSKLKDAVTRSRLVRMLRRNPGALSVAVLQSGTILVFYDQIYRTADQGKNFEPQLRFPEDAIDVFPHGIAVTPDDLVYFGEYDTGERPHPIRIMQGSADGTAWMPVYTFPTGAIFHVHSITYDRYRDRLWIATGDRNNESALLYTDDHFATIDTLGSGNQDWRIVSLTPTEKYLYWGSDNDQSGASIFRWSFETNTLENLQFIGKPSYYSAQLHDGTLVVTTTYEPESPYTQQFRPEASTDIWISRTGNDWQKVYSASFQPTHEDWGIPRPVTVLPSGDNTATLLMASVRHTTTFDFTSQRLQIIWKDLQESSSGTTTTPAACHAPS